MVFQVLKNIFTWVNSSLLWFALGILSMVLYYRWSNLYEYFFKRSISNQPMVNFSPNIQTPMQEKFLEPPLPIIPFEVMHHQYNPTMFSIASMGSQPRSQSKVEEMPAEEDDDQEYEVNEGENKN